MSFIAGWYLIYTRSRHEKKVAELLKEKNILHFLPMQKKVKNWDDRKKTVLTPLFHHTFLYAWKNYGNSTT